MEVPIMSRISGFEAGISRLQAPSLLSNLLRLSWSDDAASLQVFMWTWGPLILALVAALGSLVRRAKLLLLRLGDPKADAFSQIKDLPDAVEEEDDDVWSCCSSSDENVSVSDQDDGIERLEMDFGVSGSSRRRLSDQFSRSVVKLWDSSSTSSIVAFDSIAGGKSCAFTAGSPVLVLSADGGCRATVEVWDPRAGREAAAVVAEWAAPCSGVVGLGLSAREVVFVGGGSDARRLAVGDLRMAGSPLPAAAEIVWCGPIGRTQWSAEMAGAGGCLRS